MPISAHYGNINLEGKTIIPFCTHGGGGVDQGFKDVQKLAPEANYKDGLNLSENLSGSVRSDIEKWLKEAKVIN